jgi:hypothetical protein
MAQNIQLSYPNFTLTSQAGTFASINTADPATKLRVKNSSGGLIADYILSANMHPDNELVAVEYCGPLNLTSILPFTTFFTVERIPDYNPTGSPLSTSSQCLIKRWEVDEQFTVLNLKQQIIKSTTGAYYYDVRGAAVEHYNRTFDFALPAGQNYLDINNASNISSGNILFLGPSTDTDNVGATEKVTVSYVSGNRIYLNGSNVYQYVFGDKITFYNNIYLISDKGYGGDTRYGTIFKLNASTGTMLEYTTSGEYARIRGARWSTQVGAVAGINGSQLLFVRPYDSYLKWKSMALGNIESNDKDYFTVYDIIFDQYKIYKLMQKATTKNDSGVRSTETWSTYNYQQDTLLPYTFNIAIYMLQQHTVGPDSTRLYIQTRDQFGVALRDVNINFYSDGSDAAAEFDPLNGQAVTDINGKADVGYTPSGLYTGPTVIRVRADKSSAYTGSEYCWNSILIDGKIEVIDSFGDGSMWQDKQNSDSVRGRQLNDPYKVVVNDSYVLPPVYMHCYSFFGTPGGQWHDPSDYSSDMYKCWPWFQVTPARTDGPLDTIKNAGCEWECITYPAPPGEPNVDPCPSPNLKSTRANYIRQVLEFTQVGVDPRHYIESPSAELGDNVKVLRIPQSTWYWQYYRNVTGDDLEDGKPVPHRLYQIDIENEFRFSQLKMSKHSYWVDGVHSTDLKTNVELDQFIFVEDAVPVFFSEKNPKETDIWIRMRPFAFSLNGDTLRFFIREVWTEDSVYHDTGYYDVIERYGWPPNNDRVNLTYFDAGGGILGIEFTYDNPDIFHHNAMVYVHIEIYDTAAEPNYIYTDYWFKIIPDYKSPYIESESPARDEDQVPLDTSLYFEVKDEGSGVDIDTLEVYLNSRIVYHAGMSYNPATIIEKVNAKHYKVTIDLPYELQYGKTYSVGVRVSDISENKNMLRDSYRFYTRNSAAPWFTGFDPALCKRGMPRFRNVSFIVLGDGDGVDEQTIRIQVHDLDVTDKSSIVPVIYRIS